MVKIFVDGKEYEVDEKKNLIDGLKDNGLEIPHFCYHPKLSIAGMCRMCLIEIEGVPKFQIACNTPVKEGMKINLSGDKVVDAREGVMEFLLINHPLECPVCDKAGECRLQDYSFAHGSATTRFKEKKRNFPTEKIGTNLIINHNRCIMCYRCVRFDREVVGINDLEMLSRGNDTIIAYTPPETDAEKAPYLNHNYQGALSDICPVGALLNENTLFQSRVWWYESEESHCHGCSTLCRVTTNVKNNELYRYMPPNLPALPAGSGGVDFICDYGRFSSKDFSKERLLHYSLQGEKVAAANAVGTFAEAIQNAKKILVLGGGTESVADVDAIEESVAAWRKEGKEVAWDFRTDSAAFHDGKTQWDFLLSRDLRPNAKYLRQKNATAFESFKALEDAIRQSDLILIVNELAAPYAYQLGKIHANVKGLKIATKVDEVELFGVINSGALWQKVFLLSTHENLATELARVALPILAFPEKSGIFIDKEGSQKTLNAVLRPVEGLRSVGEILATVRAAAQPQERAV